MRRNGGRAASTLFVVLLAFVGARPGGGQALVRFVDDRGATIESPLTVCFQLALTNDCKTAPVPDGLAAPPAFTSLTVEGDDYGPTTLRREEIRASAGGPLRIAVQRKADLWVASPGRRLALSVSLYLLRDASFRVPAFRKQLPKDEERIKVPAGNFILSLSIPGDAPDLQRLSARPAQAVRVTYHSRAGWSLLLRCLAEADGRVLSGVKARLVDAPGFGQPERTLAESVSRDDGLLLFSGLTSTLAALLALHQGFLAAHASGLAAARGAFAFREVSLAAGGRVRAQVSLHGRGVSGARCGLSSPAAVPTPQLRYREIWNGNTDGRGTCLSTPLAEGRYRLTVNLPDHVAKIDRWVTLQEAQLTEEDVVLAPTHVTGTVKKGGHPVAQFTVKAVQRIKDRPPGSMLDAVGAATTDDDGRYDLTVWSPGQYLVNLASPAGQPIPGPKRLQAEGDDDEVIDFDLNASSLQGTVVDEAGKPVAQALVLMRGWSTSQSVTTADDGAFSIDLPGAGSGDVEARKRGYRTSDTYHFQVAEEGPIAPVTLVLKRGASGKGLVLTSSGAPVAGAQVTSVVATSDGSRGYAVARAGENGSFEIDLPPGPPRVFVSGPACPLFTAVLSVPDTSPGSGDPGATPPALVCPEWPVTIEVTLLDEAGKAVPHTELILRWEGGIIPSNVMEGHLTALGLSPATDGTGRLVIAGISPGAYDLFAATRTSEGMIAGGSRRGYLTSLTLPALDNAELQVTLPSTP